VVTRLGNLEMINTKVIEDLFSADFTYLQKLYNQVNLVEEGTDGAEVIDLPGKQSSPALQSSFAKR